MIFRKKSDRMSYLVDDSQKIRRKRRVVNKMNNTQRNLMMSLWEFISLFKVAYTASIVRFSHNVATVYITSALLLRKLPVTEGSETLS